jgi:hypothetical protein
LDGFPGKEVKFEGTSGGKKLTGHIRVYLVKSRLYQLLVFGQGNVTVPRADVDKFFASFKRLKK